MNYFKRFPIIIYDDGVNQMLMNVGNTLCLGNIIPIQKLVGQNYAYALLKEIIKVSYLTLGYIK